MSSYPDRSESELNTFIPKAICYGNNEHHGQDYQECYQNSAVTAIVQADGTTLTRTAWRFQNGRIIRELLTDGPFLNAIHSGSSSEAGVGAGLKIVEAWEKRREEVLTGQLNVGVYPWYGLYENIEDFLKQNPNETYLGNSTLGIIAFNQETNRILYGGVGNQSVWLIFGNGKAIKLPFGNFDKDKFLRPFISSPTYAIHSNANIEDSRTFKLKEFDLRSYAKDIEQGCALAIVTDGFLPYRENVAVIDTEKSAVADIMRGVSPDTENCLMESVNERARLTGDDTHLGIIIIKPFEHRTYLSNFMIADGSVIATLPQNLPTYNDYLDEIEGKKPKSRLRTQPVQTPVPRTSSSIKIPPSRHPTVLAKPGQSSNDERYNIWINGKFGVAIPDIQIARESQSLITRAINTYIKRIPRTTVSVEDVLYHHLQKGLVISFSKIPMGLTNEILKQVLKQPHKYFTLLNVFELSEGYAPDKVPKGEDTNKRKIGYNGIQRLCLSISKLLETSSTPSNSDQALENTLEVLNINAISAVLVESEQRKRLAGCCCLTKFLSLPSKEYQAISGIITVPKTQLVKIIEKEKQRGTDINEIIARMINCTNFNNY